MKRILTTLVLVLSATAMFAQFGLNATFQSPTTPYEDSQVAEVSNGEINTLFSSGYGIGIDYWFRPEKFRLEFMPELNYQQFDGAPFSVGQFQTRRYGLRLNMNLYLFDFLNDCKCPTFSKQDPIFQKGFFIQLSPGYQLSDNRLLPADGGAAQQQQTRNWRLAVGAGLDIGILDLITLTPFARYVREIPADPVNFYQYPAFEGLEEPLDLQVADTWSQWEFGIRLGLRFDE